MLRYDERTFLRLLLKALPRRTLHVLPHQPGVCREKPETEKREPIATVVHAALARMQREAKAVEELADAVMHFVKLLFAIGKQQERYSLGGPAQIAAQGAAVAAGDFDRWRKALLATNPDLVDSEMEADLLELIGNTWIFDPKLLPARKSRGHAVGE